MSRQSAGEFSRAEMARPKRFELLTPRFVVWCSIQLSYGRLGSLIDDRIPLKRVGDPDEIAGLVAYLASGESGYMTGSNLTIDGGMPFEHLADLR
jgi:NAD(P)-dependent dehydrogenase (short-subunit alcohol dehydrogenase family)